MIPFIPDELPEVAQLAVSQELPNAECRQISWRESQAANMAQLSGYAGHLWIGTINVILYEMY